MGQTTGILIAGVLWTAGYALWVLNVVIDSGDPSWLSIGIFWLWGFVIFTSIGSAVERMTDPRAGAWNGAGAGFLLVLFLAAPAAYFAITESRPPSDEALLAWVGAMLVLSVLGAAAGALGGWIIQTSRTRRRRQEAAELRPKLPTDG
jgi:hypothetical protein